MYCTSPAACAIALSVPYASSGYPSNLKLELEDNNEVGFYLRPVVTNIASATTYAPWERTRAIPSVHGNLLI